MTTDCVCVGARHRHAWATKRAISRSVHTHIHLMLLVKQLPRKSAPLESSTHIGNWEYLPYQALGYIDCIGYNNLSITSKSIYIICSRPVLSTVRSRPPARSSRPISDAAALEKILVIGNGMNGRLARVHARAGAGPIYRQGIQALSVAARNCPRLVATHCKTVQRNVSVAKQLPPPRLSPSSQPSVR